MHIIDDTIKWLWAHPTLTFSAVVVFALSIAAHIGTTKYAD